MEKSDPIIIQSDQNPFQRFYDEVKHLDTDELRHQIKPIIHVIDQDFKGEEHKYCDPSQLDATGKFRRPKRLIEAERRGFKNIMEMDNADKKANEDKKLKETEDLKQQILKNQQDFDNYKAVTEERFNKLVALIQASE